MTALPLITGATGFAGGHLLEYLTSQGTRLHAWGHRSAPAADDGLVAWTAVDLLDAAAVRDAIAAARRRLDLLEAHSPIALAFRWEGSATYRRLHAFCAAACDQAGSSSSIGRPMPIE